jgi:hypothetical protein
MRRLVILCLLLVSASCEAKNKVAFFNVKQNDPQYSLEIVLDSKPAGDYADKSKYRIVALTSSSPGGDWKWIEIANVTINNDNTVDITPANPNDVKQAAKLMLLVGSDPGVFNTAYERPKPGLVKGTDKTSDVYINFSYSPRNRQSSAILHRHFSSLAVSTRSACEDGLWIAGFSRCCEDR